MTTIPFRLDRRLSNATKVLSLSAIPLLASCESLWMGFAVPDPSRCNSPTSTVTCTAPQECNMQTGKCEPPFRITSITPPFVPYAGGRVDVAGVGFTTDTTAKFGGQALLSPGLDPSGHLTGTAPRAPGRCGFVDVELARPGGGYFKASGTFAYLFEPYVYSPEGQIGSYQTPISKLMVGNYDGDPDNRPDILARTSFGVYLISNQSQNEIRPYTVSFQGLPPSVDQIAAARVAGQTRPDVLLSSDTNKSIYFVVFDEKNQVYQNQPSYQLGNPVQLFTTADLDHDGTDELIVVSRYSAPSTTSSIMVFTKTLAGWSRTPQSTVLANTQFSSLATADVLAGGNDEIVLTLEARPSLMYASWDRSNISTMELPQPPGTSVYRASLSGDWNGDGRTDLAFLSQSVSRLSVQLNQPGRWDIANIDFGFPYVANQILDFNAFDINCDGRPELIINHYGSGITDPISAFFKNDGFGHFVLQDQINPIRSNGPFAVADFNGDSFPDLFVSRRSAAGEYTLNVLPGKAP